MARVAEAEDLVCIHSAANEIAQLDGTGLRDCFSAAVVMLQGYSSAKNGPLVCVKFLWRSITDRGAQRTVRIHRCSTTPSWMPGELVVTNGVPDCPRDCSSRVWSYDLSPDNNDKEALARISRELPGQVWLVCRLHSYEGRG